MKVLRIVFCILACLCVAAIVPVAVFFEWYCLLCVGGAVLFGGGMFLMRRLMQPKPLPKPDFMNSDEENERINRLRDGEKRE